MLDNIATHLRVFAIETAILRINLPGIRRIMPSVIASEVIGVQPMRGPVGSIFTLRVRYAEQQELEAHLRLHQIMAA
jgi:hypothetical protein